MSLEIASTYPEEAQLESLQRTFEYSRGETAAITLTDSVRFKQAGSFWESRLVSMNPWTINGDQAETLDGHLRISLLETAASLTEDAQPCVIEPGGESHLYILRIAQTCDGTTGKIVLRISKGK